MQFSTWNIDASQILSRQELAAVLHDLKRRAARLPNIQMNLAILRLACCCGLRASEIGGLCLGNVRVDIGRPHLLVRAAHAKLGRPRRVPLWWDAGTLADLTEWRGYRYRQTPKRDDPNFFSLPSGALRGPPERHALLRPLPPPPPPLASGRPLPP